MFNLEKFIANSVTSRSVSMFAADIEANKGKLTAEIKGKKAEDVESPFLKMLINEQEKVKGSVSSVLKDTGALTTFQKIAKSVFSIYVF